jgi:hypothetical protein
MHVLCKVIERACRKDSQGGRRTSQRSAYSANRAVSTCRRYGVKTCVHTFENLTMGILRIMQLDHVRINAEGFEGRANVALRNAVALRAGGGIEEYSHPQRVGSSH